MMYRLLCLLVVSGFAVSVIAADLPTPASKPLPNINTVQNTDTVLTEKVQAKIKKTPILNNQPVSAASHEGEVVLQGMVESKEQERAAIEAAKSVPGVKTVQSQLTIGNHSAN